MATQNNTTPCATIYCVMTNVEQSDGAHGPDVRISRNFDDIEPAILALSFLRKSFPGATVVKTQYRRNVQ
jgi:hypothetical protein